MDSTNSSKMPRFKQTSSLVNLTTSICASMVHKSSLFLDSISWPPTQSRLPEQVLREGIGGGASSPNLSPLNPHHAAVILSPNIDFLETSEASSSSTSSSGSAFSQNYVDFSKQLRVWLRQMPVHLLEQVVSKANTFFHCMDTVKRCQRLSSLICTKASLEILKKVILNVKRCQLTPCLFLLPSKRCGISSFATHNNIGVTTCCSWHACNA